MSATAEATVTLNLIDRITAPIRRISARLSSLSKRIGIDKISRSIGELGARFKDLGGGIARTTGRLTALMGVFGASGAGVIASAYGLARSVADIGGEIDDATHKLKIGSDALQEYRFVAKMSGVETASFDKAVEKLGINAGEASNGNKQLAASFRTLGVRVTDSKGQMRPMEDILDDTMLALTKIKDPLKQNSLAFKVFGKSGVEVTKMLADGADGIKGWREEARKSGSMLSRGAVLAAADMGDAIERLTTRLKGLQFFVGAQLVPVFTELLDNLTDWYDTNSKLIHQKLSDWARGLVGVIRDLFDPTSKIRQQFAGFAEKVGELYAKIKPLVDLIGGPLNVALALIGLWALAPAITAVTLLSFAFGGLAKSIAGVGLDLLTQLSGGVADFAGAGLGKTLEAAGAKSGNLWGKAFALAARVAIIAGIAAIALEVLQKYDPKGNLGGFTKPVDDYLRKKLGLPEKDTGITPGEIWQGTKNWWNGGSKPDGEKAASAGPVREKCRRWRWISALTKARCFETPRAM